MRERPVKDYPVLRSTQTGIQEYGIFIPPGTNPCPPDSAERPLFSILIWVVYTITNETGGGIVHPLPRPSARQSYIVLSNIGIPIKYFAA